MLGAGITDYRISRMLLIPSAGIWSSEHSKWRRFDILQDKDRTREPWSCTNMEDKTWHHDIRAGDIWQDYHEGWDTGTGGDMCQNVSWDGTPSKSLTFGWVNQKGSTEFVLIFGWCMSNRDRLNLLLRDVMDWLLVSCYKQRYRGDRCGLVTIKIQKLYWSHYSQNTAPAGQAD